MGVVDIFKLQCPHCGNVDETSTKAAENPCCDRYWPHDAPEAVLIDVAKDNPYRCLKCGELYVLDVAKQMTTPLVDTSRVGLVRCEFRHVMDLTNRDADVTIARVRLAAVPDRNELINVNGDPWIVYSREWAFSPPEAPDARRKTGVTVGLVDGQWVDPEKRKPEKPRAYGLDPFRNEPETATLWCYLRVRTLAEHTRM